MPQKIAFGVFLTMGVVNLFAVQAGLTQGLGLHWLPALLLAVPVFYLRYVGSIAGILGAVVGWQMPLPLAVILFAWPALVYALMRGAAEAAAWRAARRTA
ncbi:hypothetical protein [Methylobacterium oryzisoli]|uniref:hypothetical protein n=1 Tax=Methylobacterium oryzisoli TaxID=3385502 RepID=UPI0038926A2E